MSAGYYFTAFICCLLLLNIYLVKPGFSIEKSGLKNYIHFIKICNSIIRELHNPINVFYMTDVIF